MRSFIFAICFLQAITVAAQRIDYKVCIPEKDTLDRVRVVKIAEVDAEPEGGMSAFYKIINQLLSISPNAATMDFDSHVDFTFIVDTKGNVRNFCLFRKGLAKLDESELYKRSRWKPALLNGKPVPQRFIIPMIVELR